MFAATDWAGVALVITAVGSLMGSLGALLVTLRRIGSIEDAVHTSDGRKIGELVEHNFATRALHVPEPERTPSEKTAVGRLSVGEAHPPPVKSPSEPS